MNDAFEKWLEEQAKLCDQIARKESRAFAKTPGISTAAAAMDAVSCAYVYRRVAKMYGENYRPGKSRKQ